MYTPHVHDVNMIDVYTICDNPPMETMGDRLKKARVRAGIGSARQAALKLNLPPSSYSAHENGQNDYDDEAARLYAKAFGVSAGWLLTGEGAAKNSNTVKVMGRIGAGAEISPDEEQVPPEGLSEIEVPFPLPDNAIAFEVEGTSMWPRYDPGDVIVCLNRERDPADLVGWEAAVKTSKGHRYLKRLRPGARRGLFDLESHNDEPIRGVRLVWASEVHSVVRAGQWRALSDAARQRLVGKIARGGR